MMIRACQSPPVNRSQPLLTPEPSPKDDKHRIGEVAGGTAAECAAICCCCPCGLMNLLLLAVYKVPKGLCKKALKKRKRQKVMKKKKLLQQQHHHEQKSGPTHRYDESEEESDQSEVDLVDGSTEADDPLEEEMWNYFHGAGFWRSRSQKTN